MVRLKTALADLARTHSETAERRLLGDIQAHLTEYNELAQSKIRHLGKYAMARVYGASERPLTAPAALIRPN
ncbi:hypothetical protein NDU88_002074 [Pleurodeles waltl]|uniref:Uncharacterized protein n=1 Tax=Pleurodeles waltl TaxID=8319 RepID=A0AAV7KUI6_PLEWA|nr:hypothetical protein NDU88_002074 [Pleurodeles waltl]